MTRRGGRVRERAAIDPAAQEAILAWYGERGRPLAFRRTRDPYAILVSEAMAQQTQAARAAAYWGRFMERFPTVESLAAASPADVLRAWQGLGYDRRALDLRRAARVIVDEHAGQVPSSLDALEALPGVGPYTARAVAALAFGTPVGAVDVNVRRVLGRIVAGSAEALPPSLMQDLADASVSRDQPGTWTHALMDLGATLCRARAPRCSDCPARPWCVAADTTAPAVPVTVSVRQPARVPFPSTRRWLRGRILDLLRSAPDGTWIELDSAIGLHPIVDVHAAAEAMYRDGVIDVRTVGKADTAGLWARLPIA